MYRSKLIKLASIMAIAFGLKYHYSVASVNDLRWILAPTAFAVELVTGTDFTFESQAGYMSADNTFLIAASCSGVNFLIIAYVMLAVGKFWRKSDGSWTSVGLALVAAYFATIVANSIRIVGAMILQGFEYPVYGLSFDDVHRVEGIVVYFGSLLALFLISERATGNLSDAIARRYKFLLAIYYAVTLGIPVLRGEYFKPGFWEHAIVVLTVPLTFVLPFVVFRTIRERVTPRHDLR